MEEFRLGGVQSGLSVLCHMVSLIAVFLGVFFYAATGRCTKREVEKGEGKKKNGSGAKVGIVLMSHFVVSLQIEPEGSAVLFMVSADSGEPAAKFSMARTLEGSSFGC